VSLHPGTLSFATAYKGGIVAFACAKRGSKLSILKVYHVLGTKKQTANYQPSTNLKRCITYQRIRHVVGIEDVVFPHRIRSFSSLQSPFKSFALFS
jgi:hypothetical protein